MAAVIWIVITLVTGGSASFAFIGGILCGLVVFAIGYLFRRFVFKGNRPSARN